MKQNMLLVMVLELTSLSLQREAMYPWFSQCLTIQDGCVLLKTILKLRECIRLLAIYLFDQ